MTTFILHGGKTSTQTFDNTQFFRQFSFNCPKDEVTILLSYWASKKEKWPELIKRDIQTIRTGTEKTLNFLVADSVGDFPCQLGQSDVFYIAGGEQENIEPYISVIADSKNLLADKIFIGSSMGAFLACRNYVLSFETQDTSRVYRGLSLLPFNILCHWNIENKKSEKISLLKTKDPGIPILLLDEEKYQKFIF